MIVRISTQHPFNMVQATQEALYAVQLALQPLGSAAMKSSRRRLQQLQLNTGSSIVTPDMAQLALARLRSAAQKALTLQAQGLQSPLALPPQLSQLPQFQQLAQIQQVAKGVSTNINNINTILQASDRTVNTNKPGFH